MNLLRNLHPNASSIEMFSKNVNGDKNLSITIEGVKYAVSKGLTALVRSGEVKLDQIGNYAVRTIDKDAAGKEVSPYLQVGLVGEDISVKIAGWSGNIPQRKEFSLDDFGVSMKDLKATV